MKRTVILGVALSSLALLLWAETAQAQLFFGRGRGGVSVGIGTGYGGYGYGSGYGYGRNYGWGTPYVGWGSGYGYGRSYPWASNYGYGFGRGYYGRGSSYYGGSYYSPSYYSGSYYTPSYSYSTPSYYISPVVSSGISTDIVPSSYQSFYPADSNGQVPTWLRVIVPAPDAKVWIEGNATQQTGTERIYESPPLDASKTYTYTVKAQWLDNGREVTREKEIQVQPGREAVAVFDNADNTIRPRSADDVNRNRDDLNRDKDRNDK